MGRPGKLVSSQPTRPRLDARKRIPPIRSGRYGGGPPYFFPPMMRNNFVPQSGHTPWMAGRPFFIVTSCALAISFFALHFTQYASATVLASPPVRLSLEKLSLHLTGSGQQASRYKTATKQQGSKTARQCPKLEGQVREVRERLATPKAFGVPAWPRFCQRSCGSATLI